MVKFPGAMRLAAAIAITAAVSRGLFDWGFTYWQAHLINTLSTKDAPEFWWTMLWVIPILAVEAALVAALTVSRNAWTVAKRIHSGTRDAELIVDAALLGVVRLNEQDLVQSVLEDSRTDCESTASLTTGLLASLTGAVLFGFTLGSILPVVSVGSISIPLPLVWFAVIAFGASSYLIHRTGQGLLSAESEVAAAEAYARNIPSRVRENAAAVALLGGHGWEAESFVLALKKLRDPLALRARLLAKVRALSAVLGPSDLLVWVALSTFYFQGQVTLGQVFQAGMAHRGVGMALDWFVQNYGELARLRAARDRIAKWRETTASFRTMHQAASLHVKRADFLELKEVSLKTPDRPGEPAAWTRQYPDIRVLAGDSVVLQAPSGFGKSALFLAVSGSWVWGKGQILCPRNAAFVPQRSYFPDTTLIEALCYPDKVTEEKIAVAAHLLKRLGMDSFANRLSDRSHWNGTFSGGEAARASLVRALLARPDWIFLDEPTANLDERSSRMYWQVLADESRATQVVIAHGDCPGAGFKLLNLDESVETAGMAVVDSVTGS
jgi:vitamin B12/bleomycin/antimicrobial peptide transport system ATP-binding/permease protein